MKRSKSRTLSLVYLYSCVFASILNVLQTMGQAVIVNRKCIHCGQCVLCYFVMIPCMCNELIRVSVKMVLQV